MLRFQAGIANLLQFQQNRDHNDDENREHDIDQVLAIQRVPCAMRTLASGFFKMFGVQLTKTGMYQRNLRDFFRIIFWIGLFYPVGGSAYGRK